MRFAILSQHSNHYRVSEYGFLNMHAITENLFLLISHCISTPLHVVSCAFLPLTLKMITILCFKLISHYLLCK